LKNNSIALNSASFKIQIISYLQII